MKLYQLINKETNSAFLMNLDTIESISVLPVMNEGDEQVARVRTASGDKFVVSMGSLMTSLNHSKIEVMTFQAPEQTEEVQA